MCAPPAIVPVGPCVCRLFLTQVLLWFGLELPHRGIANGGGIRDARVKVHQVNWFTESTPEAQDPGTQLQIAHSGGRDSCTAFNLKSPTK